MCALCPVYTAYAAITLHTVNHTCNSEGMSESRKENRVNLRHFTLYAVHFSLLIAHCTLQMVGQCMYKCPMVGEWVSNCPTIGQCKFKRPIVEQCMSNCPIVVQCMSNCPMIEQCMFNCPMVQNKDKQSFIQYKPNPGLPFIPLL